MWTTSFPFWRALQFGYEVNRLVITPTPLLLSSLPSLNLSISEVQMEKNQEMVLTQVRKALDKLDPSPQNYEDHTLMRFLIARSMDPTKAAKMFVQWKKWRQEFVPLGYIPDSQVPDELDSRKVFLQGLTRDGHAVLVIKSNRHFAPKDQLQFKRFVVHLLDKTLASTFKDGKERGNEKMIGIVDLANISYKNIDARALITGFQFLQNYYPERLAKLYLLSMPWFFVSVWKMVCHFLEKATLEKIVIVSNQEERIQLIEEIGEEILPEEYGGRAKLVALQDVTLTSQKLIKSLSSVTSEK